MGQGPRLDGMWMWSCCTPPGRGGLLTVISDDPAWRLLARTSEGAAYTRRRPLVPPIIENSGCCGPRG